MRCQRGSWSEKRQANFFHDRITLKIIDTRSTLFLSFISASIFISLFIFSFCFLINFKRRAKK